MANLLNPLSDLGRSSADVAQKIAKISLDSAERTFAVQLEYAKGALTQASVNARAMRAVNSGGSLGSLPTRLAENALENFMGYSRSLYEVASEAQGRYARLAEEHMSEFQNAVTQSVDEAAKSAPVGGGDLAVAAIKSQLAAATAAFDTMTKAARSMASLADAGVTAAARPARPR